MQPFRSTLHRVPVRSVSLAGYDGIVDPELLAQVRGLAADLRGLRVVQVNSTAVGGGVAELLQSLVPLERGLGLEVEWRLLCPDEALFAATKHLHNALQGLRTPLSPDELTAYEEQNAHCAPMLGTGWDVAVIHDPQPALLRALAPGAAAHWLWRCHIDTSDPEPAAWRYVREIVKGYGRAIFTLPQFAPTDLGIPIDAIAPAIDPLTTKNSSLPDEVTGAVLSRFGIDPNRPLVVQVGRFDPWKDPLGVIDAFERVRTEVPNVQLALVGAMATDDPEGWELLRQVLSRAEHVADCHVLSNLDGVGAHEVNAFQRRADVAVQKSIREGFGLTVSEALWKATPVIGGRAGGIPLQLGTQSELLVDTVEECADRVISLLGDGFRRAELGRQGRERVRRHFLLPRLLRDELRVMRTLVEHASAA
jgi:trehalose synthase